MILATIEKLENLRAHPNADRLEICDILGFQCVVPKGLYNEGDLVVYIQTDTVLPADQEWAEEYIRYSPKRTKAVKLRGEWSEGIVAPLSKWINHKELFFDGRFPDDCIGDDVSASIGVTKYEPQLPSNESVIGTLPYGLGKTDEDRFENLRNLPLGEIADVTLKIDGQSATFGYFQADGRFFVCGRRFEVDAEEENRYSIHVPKLKDTIIEYCKKHNVSLAFRGESYGNGIQKNPNNPHSTKEHSFALFSVWNIDKRRYERKGDKHYFLNVADETGIETVPLLEECVEITPELIKKYSVGLKKIDGQPFEGVVVQYKDGSFKIINKDYDSKK